VVVRPAHARSPSPLVRLAVAATDPVVLGWAVTVVALGVLAGWATGTEALVRLGASNPPVPPQAAVCFAISGVAVALHAGDRDRRTLLLIAGGLSFAVGIAHLAIALVDEPTVLDRLLFEAETRAAGVERRGRLSPTTCLGLSAIGITMVALGRGERTTAHMGSLFIVIVTLGSLWTYAYDLSVADGQGDYSDVSLLSAALFVVLALAILRATADQGLSRLTDTSPVARVMLRRVLPVVAAVPFVVGWLLLRTEEIGVFDRDLAEAMMAALSAGIAGVVVWRSAALIAEHEAELNRSVVELDGAVQRRTAQLEALNQTQRESLDALEEGLAVVTREAEVRLLNKAGVRILGYTAEEVGALFKAARWETFREDGTPMRTRDQPIIRTIATGEPTTGVYVRWRAKDGALVLLRASTRPLVDERGEVWAAVVAFSDYTGHRGIDHVTAEGAIDVAAGGEPLEPGQVGGTGRHLTPESRNRILIAAADSDQAKGLHETLTFAGYQVVVADAGDEALLLTRKQRPSLLLVHTAAPGLGGYDVLAAVKSDLVIASTAVVILDPSPTGPGTAAALTAGATDVLRFPLDDVELVARIEASMRLAARTRDLLHLSRALDRASRTDPLTGLLNRRGIDDEVERHAASALVSGEQCGVLVLDLDHFKTVNDSYGHPAGDRALRAVADAVLSELRADDAAGRWGGEEFLVLLPHTDEAGTVAVAERIRKSVAALRVPDDLGEPFTLTVSIGAAVAVGAAVRNATTTADQRLLAAKAAGRNCVISTDGT
jgi:diguanylate cyclase (GGDEF)-like protein/PAS domain S-box-containing protein